MISVYWCGDPEWGYPERLEFSLALVDRNVLQLTLDDETEDILGIEVPAITIPVHPGRNLAVVLEIAAMNHRQKKLGYNTAEEFNKRLMEQMEAEAETEAEEE